MKKLILILLLMPLTILCQDDYPEWERVDLNMDSLSWYGTMEVNSRNELIMVLSNGIFKSTDFGENWIKFNAPDSIIYDYTFLKTNGPTIYTYGEVLDIYKKPAKYFVYSNDYGENWQIFPKDEITFSEYDSTEFVHIDNNGEIWGIGSNKKIDSTSKIVVNKFDILNKKTIKMFELPVSFKKISFLDSLIVLVDLIPENEQNHNYPSPQDICIYFSYNNGILWDSVRYKHSLHWIGIREIKNFCIFKVKDTLYMSMKIDPLFYDCIMKIDLNSKKLIAEQTYPHIDTQIKKFNDSIFYKIMYRSDMSGMPGLYRSTDMKNWVNIVPENQTSFRLLKYWIMDKSENNYFFCNYGLARTDKGDTTCRIIKCEGLEYYWIDLFAVDSKSNIAIININNRYDYENYNDYIIKYNPDTKVKSINKDFDLIDNHPDYNDNFLISLLNHTYIFYNEMGRFSIILNQNLDERIVMIIKDTLFSEMFINIDNKGKNFIAFFKDDNYYHQVLAYSEDYCETWNLFEPFNLPDSLKYGHFILNKNSDLVLFGRTPNFNLSHDKGKTWVNIFNDSTNKLYNNKKYPDKYNYNESNGSGIVKYNSGGPIYYTLDHGYTWSEIDSNSQAFKFIHEIDKYTLSENQRNLPVSYDENFTFYVSTLHGIYRSTDTLKSFHNITKGIVEPNYIYNFQAGNDGRLYAVNYNGIWRTKKKILNSVEGETGPVISGDMRLKVYPNPAGDYIIIQTSEVSETSEVYKVQIFDMLGIDVSPAGGGVSGADGGGFRIDVSHLPTGVYFIRIGDKAAKFVKM